jgi:hypothetical protein
VVVTAGIYFPQGELEDDQALAGRLLSVNFGNTILFCDASNIEKGIVELLKQIAEENGGIFKVVDTKDY